MRTALVVASNRADNIAAFFRAWMPFPWDCTVVVEDGPKRTFNMPKAPRGCSLEEPGVTVDLHACWADIDDECGDAGKLFSRRDGALKVYGFWLAAYRCKADVIMVLDDDCFPAADTTPMAFVRGHLRALEGGPRWVPSVPDTPTRGVPYGDLGLAGDVAVNMGLWDDVADYDAPQSLALKRAGVGLRHYEAPRGSRLMHPDHYWPFCGMNIAFRREVLPLMYFPKMGLGSAYGRMDDIWGGIILQRCARHLGLRLAAGDPPIHHTRASDIMVNLEKEASGIRANEEFWRVVDAVDLADSRTPLECMRRLGRHFHAAGPEAGRRTGDEKFGNYLAELGGYVRDWCELLGRAGWPGR